MKPVTLLQHSIFTALCVIGTASVAQRPSQRSGWQQLYQAHVHDGMPLRVMAPIQIETDRNYPLIVSLHGAGGKGNDNRKQLKDWNKQLAEPERRKEFPCYVVAPQAKDLWNNEDFKKIKSYVKTLPAVDHDRIYIMGHSMGGHGTYIFIQLDPEYFAAAAPSAGSGLRRTEDFIDPSKIKDVPIWAFHGDRDRVVPISRSQRMVDETQYMQSDLCSNDWVDMICSTSTPERQ